MSGPYDLVVTGGTAVLPDGVRAADIGVRDGRIAAVAAPGTLPAALMGAARTVNAAGLHVLPGLIDSHVHFRTPGLTHKEDWAHGSRAAAAGGITMVLDMPNTRLPLFTPPDLAAKQAQVAGTSLVDHGFHVGVDPDRLGLVREFAGLGVSSVKAFLAGHHTAPHVLRGAAAVRRLFDELAGTGLLAMFHAECAGVFDLLDSWQVAPRTWQDYERHRPRTGAIVAVAPVIEACRDTGVPAHVLHVSTLEEADLLTAAAAAGIPITFEVTAHHLSFEARDTETLGARIRLSPAIRTRADQDRLWAAVRGGHARTIGSDHAPHEPADKLLSPADAPPGLPGVQELVPALFTGLRVRWPDDDVATLLGVLVRVLGSAPARLFALDGRKGRIATGLDADLVVFDPEARWNLTDGAVQSRCGWSAYQGRTFVGRVHQTIRRGQMIFDGPSASFGSPSGEFIHAGSR